MLFLQHKTLIRRFLLPAVVLYLFAFQANTEEQSQDTELPTLENWYQVEVVLFDQKSILGDEQAPKDIRLEFPKNWIELHSSYQNTGIMRRPIFDTSSNSSLTEPYPEALSKRINRYLDIQPFQYITDQNYGLTLVPEARIPYQDNNQLITDDPLSREELEPELELDPENDAVPLVADFLPVFESPFRILDKKDRDLNDTVRALNRRNYKVQFHQAWRFEVTSKEESEWIILKAGDQVSERYSIEGALRFYKSRFLHFETDLWKFIFAKDRQTEILLPEIPQKPMTSEEAVLVGAMQFSNSYIALTPNPLQTPSLIQDALTGYNLKSITPFYTIAQDNLVTDSIEQQSNSYPIQEIWPIKQSKRLQEDEVYYIDHPQMGALVTIKAYKPKPINLPLIQPDVIEEQVLEANN